MDNSSDYLHYKFEEQRSQGARPLLNKNNTFKTPAEQKEETMENVFHQTRNLVQHLIANIDELRSGDIKLSGYIEKQNANFETLVELINRVLHGDNHKRFAISYQNIDELLSRYIEKYSTLAKQKNLQFYCDVEANICIETNAVCLGDIIDNLLNNSIKYTSSGYIKFTAIRDRTGIVVCVEDTGCGIAEEHILSVFKRGYRIDNKLPGSGIGLGIVQDYVDILGGSLSIKSQVNIGTTIKVEFTANALGVKEKVDGDRYYYAARQLTTIKIDNQLSVKNTRDEVLLVEDDIELAHHYHNILKGEYRVTIAHTGEQAISMACKNIPSIVISDVLMEGVTGFDVVAALRRNPKTRHIPLILLTAKAGQRDRVHGFSSGANDYIVKPVQAHEFRLRVRNQLNLVRNIRNNLLKNEVKEEDVTNRNEVVEKYLHIVKTRFSEPELSLKDITNKLNITKKQLERKVKQVLGVTPKQYLIEFRLTHAKELLLRGEKASKTFIVCGFSSHSYFSSKFKEKYGYSPSEYSTILQNDLVQS